MDRNINPEFVISQLGSLCTDLRNNLHMMQYVGGSSVLMMLEDAAKLLKSANEGRAFSPVAKDEAAILTGCIRVYLNDGSSALHTNSSFRFSDNPAYFEVYSGSDKYIYPFSSIRSISIYEEEEDENSSI